MGNKRITALFIAVDEYSVVWGAMKESIKNLKECYGIDSIISSNGGGDKWDDESVPFYDGGISFSSRIREGLSHIDTEYVLIMLEDYYVKKGHFDFDKYLDLADEMNIDYLRIYPYAKKGKNISKYLRKIYRRQRYAFTVRPSIWRASFLYEFVKDNEMSPWEFEKSFNKESVAKMTPDVYRSNEFLPFIELVSQGKLIPSAKRFLEKESIEIPDMPIQSRQTIFKIWVAIRRNVPFLYKHLDK